MHAVGSIRPLPISLIIMKVAARCNLNCSYCFEFNLADQSWRESPAIMSDEVFEGILARVKRHSVLSGQTRINLSFHGGEPMLIGLRRFESWCESARARLAPLEVTISLQTNATLLTPKWAQALRANNVNVGVSLDGPKIVNDRERSDRRGRGSYDKVLRGISFLQDAGASFGILTVIPLGADPLQIHHHFLELGCKSLSYLYPDVTHDTFGDLHEKFGPTPCADFLIPIFDDWWHHSTMEVRIRNFWEMARLIMGGRSGIDALGNEPLRFLVVASNGDIEGLDVLKACGDGFVKTGLNVLSDDFVDLIERNPLHAAIVFDSLPLATQCLRCIERETCGGGYHPHRYSSANGFQNPSVWCADLMRLFTHMRARLEVSPSETNRLRKELLAAPEAETV
jgi:uncharacterized protein